MAQASGQHYPVLPQKIILMSTKAYFSPQQTTDYLMTILSSSASIMSLHQHNVMFGIIPDFLSLLSCAKILDQARSQTFNHPKSWPLHLGAQDCYPSTEYGPFTGSIVPPALVSVGVTIVEMGHAERRRLLHETDETTSAKAVAAAACGLIPLVCIGETEAPDLRGPMSAAIGNAMRQLTPQITSLLSAVPIDTPVIFAYEPVWAIGADEPASVDFVGPVVQAIRQVIADFDVRNNRTGQTKVIYGGSAGPGLWSGKTNGGNPLGQRVDGMFLGRFSHQIDGLRQVIDEVAASTR